MNMINTLLTEKFVSGGQNRFSETVANLKVNDILFDCEVNLTANDITAGVTAWDFLKGFNVNLALRLGSSNGSAINLIHNVNLYQILEYSDFKAGVSMNSTDFTTAGVKRISGLLPIGFFAMGERDAIGTDIDVDTTVTMPENGVSFTISAVYKETKATLLRTYQSSTPTGADQPYTNVVEVFYDSPTVVTKSAGIKGKTVGSQSINLEDAIALSNAEGNFEFFQRFGQIFVDPFDLGRNLSINVPPTSNNDGECLIVCYAFYPELLLQNDTEQTAERNNVVANIKAEDGTKAKYLKLLGVID